MGQVSFGRRAICFSMASCRQWGHVKQEQGGTMDRLTSTLTYLVLVLTMSGCATIVDGTSQPVTFNSEPNRAKILINGVQVGVTPLTIQVKRAKNTMIVAKKDGYEPQQLPLQTKTNTYFWGNILFLYGSTTDYFSEAMIEYSPNMYFITLDPMRKSEADRDRLSEERKVRTFILINHANLAQDLAQGAGEYLSSLSSMLAVRGTPPQDIVQRLRMVSASHQDPPSFAEAVVQAFLRG
jgi:hypothetical protein